MKRTLLFVLIIILTGCNEKSNGYNDIDRSASLVFEPEAVGNIVPITLIHLKDGFHLIYNMEADKGNTAVLRQAISKDLFYWSESAKIDFPNMTGSVVYGGIVNDSNNISGLGSKEAPPLVAVLTCSQNPNNVSDKKVVPVMAGSIDGGNTWALSSDSTDFPAPFLNKPQNTTITWHEQHRKWMMAVAVGDHAEFYSSVDLRHWKFESSLGTNFFPDEVKWKRVTLFPDATGSRWAVLADIKKSGNDKAGGTVYFIGSFDGHTFKNESSELHWLDYGKDIYGSTIAIASDGRRINLGWKNLDSLQNTQNQNNISAIAALPREIKFENYNGRPFLAASPVRELKQMYGKEVSLNPLKVSYKDREVQLASKKLPPYEVVLSFNSNEILKGSFPTKFGISFQNSNKEQMNFGYDRFGYYYLEISRDRTAPVNFALYQPLKMPFLHGDSTITFRFIVHQANIECFAEGGKLAMTSPYSVEEPFSELKLFAVSGNIDLIGGKILELKKDSPKSQE